MCNTYWLYICLKYNTLCLKWKWNEYVWKWMNVWKWRQINENVTMTIKYIESAVKDVACTNTLQSKSNNDNFVCNASLTLLPHYCTVQQTNRGKRATFMTAWSYCSLMEASTIEHIMDGVSSIVWTCTSLVANVAEYFIRKANKNIILTELSQIDDYKMITLRFYRFRQRRIRFKKLNWI